MGGVSNWPPMDTILLEGIVVPAELGVIRAERRMRRPVDIDIELQLDLRAAGESDRLANTIDYGEVYKTVEAVAQEREYRLVEALAEAIARALLEAYPVDLCRLKVRKRSPVPGNLSHAGVAIERRR